MNEEQWEKYEAILDRDDTCAICHFSDICKGLTSGPSGPLYPPCSDKEPEQWVDTNLLDQYELEEE